MTQALSENALARALGSRTFRYYDSVDSTNEVAVQWVRSGEPPPSGAVVVAEEQTRGRGRFSRAWLTPRGSAVAMSVILHGRVPGLPAAAAGLAVRDAVSALVDAECGLKWPNDVEIEGRKCAGILVEAVKGAKSPCYVVGIGINVSVDFSAAGAGAAEETAAGPQAAEETAAGPHGAEGGAAGPGGSEEAAGDVRLGSTATSVCEYRDCNAAPVDRAALIRQVADNLSEYSGSTALLDLFRSALTTLGKDVRVSTGAEVVEGRAVDVDEVGRLLVREPGGSTHRLSAGDVSLSVR